MSGLGTNLCFDPSVVTVPSESIPVTFIGSKVIGVSCIRLSIKEPSSTGISSISFLSKVIADS